MRDPDKIKINLRRRPAQTNSETRPTTWSTPKWKLREEAKEMVVEHQRAMAIAAHLRLTGHWPGRKRSAGKLKPFVHMTICPQLHVHLAGVCTTEHRCWTTPPRDPEAAAALAAKARYLPKLGTCCDG
jgi:hypothetical protein